MHKTIVALLYKGLTGQDGKRRDGTRREGTGREEKGRDGKRRDGKGREEKGRDGRSGSFVVLLYEVMAQRGLLYFMGR